MNWGDRFRSAWNAATDAGRAAAEAIASGAKKVGVAARATAQAVGESADATKAAAVAAGRKAVAAGEALKNKVVAAGQAVADKGRAAASAAYQKAQYVFGTRQVGQPIEPCPSDVAQKKERLRQRAELITRGKAEAARRQGEGKKNLQAAVDRLELNNVAVERARLAEDVYKDNSNGPTGWKRMSEDDLKKLNLDPGLFRPKDSNFRAALYESTIDGKQTKVLAFKGTTSWEDWKNNILQGTGHELPYYQNAIDLARDVKAATDGNFETAGHSLGGGMSSAASLVTGAKGYTFNAAGVHPNTIKDFGVNRAMGESLRQDGRPLIDAFQVEGEILTTVQNPTLQTGMLATGTMAPPPVSIPSAAILAKTAITGEPLAYSAIGKIHKLPVVGKIEGGKGYSQLSDRINIVRKHDIGLVINGLEQQKADDIYTIKQALGGS